MAEAFNPYHRWLGIPTELQPPDHYTLLGLKQFESEPDVIDHAADRQMAHLRRFGLGQQRELAERLLGEVATARACLLDPTKKSLYDAELRTRLQSPSQGSRQDSANPRSRMPVARPLVHALQPAHVSPPLVPPEAPTVALPVGRPSWSIALAVGITALVLLLLVVGVAVFLRGGRNQTYVAQASDPQAAPAGPAPHSPSPVEAGPASNPQVPDPDPPTPAPGVPPADSPVPATTEPSPLADSLGENQSPPAPSSEPASPPDASVPVAEFPAIPSGGRLAPSAAPVDSRLPVPSEEAAAEAEKQVREVFAAQIAEAKSAEDRGKLIEELKQQGVDLNNPAEVRYAALRLAESVAVDGEDAEEAIRLIELRGQSFSIPVPVEKVALLAKLAEAVSADARPALLKTAQREFSALAQTDSYEDSLALGRFALGIAQAARDRDAIEQITALGREVRSRQQAFAGVQAALTRLQSDPDDATAHSVVGRWHWFVKQDAALGIKHLAAGADGTLAAAAKADHAEPEEATQQMQLADQWRELAQQEEAEGRQALLERADHWYARALPGLSGLNKVRAERQRQELASALRPAGNSTPPESNVATTTGQQPPKSGWKPPGRNSTAAFRSFLGVYMYWLDRKKMYPVINLQVPNRNLWTQEVQDKARGHMSFDELSYAGTAKIAVPADGVYVLEAATLAKVTINGQDTGGSGDVNIRKGIHVVTFEIHNRGGVYVPDAYIAIRHKETGEEVPFFNTWQDIQRFVSTPINGQRAIEVSGWEPGEENEVKLDPKTLKVIPK